jgi:hypothetical protein
MPHLTEDDLVLHYYGELDAGGESRVTAHLSDCTECHRSYVRLQRVMAAVDTVPVPAIAEGFERTVWARLEPTLPVRRNWFSAFVFSPANLAWLGAVLVLVAGAFFAGRMSQPTQSRQARGADIAESILLVDLGEHLERSQTMLVELVSTEPRNDVIDLTTERDRALDLVAANRLYRQTASERGDTAITELLDDLERLLVELAASPDQLSSEDLAQVQQRIAADDLLFKVRVISSAIKERQKQQKPAMTGA